MAKPLEVTIAAVRQSLEMLDRTMSEASRGNSRKRFGGSRRSLLRHQQPELTAYLKQRNVDGERVPTPSLPNPVVPREATGALGHSGAPGGRSSNGRLRSRETPANPLRDTRMVTLSRTELRAEPSDVGGDRVARPAAADDPRDEPSRAKKAAVCSRDCRSLVGANRDGTFVVRSAERLSRPRKKSRNTG